jgi:hypothetical protein
VSHHTIDQLIDLWKREKLTTEQMIGQILQLLREQDQPLREVARRPPSGTGGDVADPGGRPRQR